MKTDVAERFATIFRGREDCWGALHGECKREKLTLGHYERQLTGEESLGIYPLLADGTCYWAAVDLDDDNVEAALRLMVALYELGVKKGVGLERSKSKGYHTWIFFDGAVSAKDVRLLLRVAAKKADLLDYEVFPKQDSLSETPTGVGSYLHLPYFGDNGDGRRQFCDVRTLEPVSLETFLGEYSPFPVKFLSLVLDGLPPDLKRVAEAKKPLLRLDEVIPEGERNETLFRAGCKLRRSGLSFEEILAALLVMNENRCRPPVTDEEVREAADSAAKYNPAEGLMAPPEAPPEAKIIEQAERAPRTDAGNAELFARLHGDRLRYDHKRKRWLVWAEHWWIPDADAKVIRLAKETARWRYDAAPSIADLTERGLEAKWAIRSEARTYLDAALYLARAEHPITDAGDNWDSDPYLMGVANGILDLSSGQLRNGRPDDYISMRSPVHYDPTAKCPRFLTFLDRIMDGNSNLVAFLQRVAGYSLTANVSQQALFFAYGTGANGKSTFIGAVLDILGDYGGMAPPGLLLKKRIEAHPTEFAALMSKRFVASVEVNEGRWLAEAVVKWLTGGDRMSARHMREDYKEFAPTYKIFLAANRKPTITGTDIAIWRRINLIPFTVIIPTEEQDRQLPEKLKEESAGILNWALEGCLEWQRNGLNPPAEVQAAVRAYREEQDVLGAFIEERCLTGPDLKVTVDSLYTDYSTWAKDSGEKPMTKKMMGLRLEERGFTDGKISGKRARFGVGLKWTHQDGG